MEQIFLQGLTLQVCFYPLNNGGSWTAINKGLTDTSVLSLAVFGTNIFADTEGGGVFKRSLSDILAGVENISADNDISIYPNPATNQLTIHSSSFHNEAVTVSIMNVLGEMMQEEKASPQPSPKEREFTINIKNLPAGIYFLEIKTENGSVVKRFVKE